MITLSLIVLLLWGVRLAGESLLGRWALILILGGALGNWIDRLRFGGVVDFLDFRIWPVFNLADTAISIGVGLFIIQFLFRAQSSERNHASA